jgi:outer membrane lipoprotein-sorting protein
MPIGKNMYIKSIRFLLSFLFITFIGQICPAQDMMTVDEYFDNVSKVYGKVTDYKAQITITQDKTIMKGVIYYKSPNLLRIDFSDPAGQVIDVDGEKLTIYLPEHSVILKQELPKRSKASLEMLNNTQGLNYLRNNYKAAFVIGPDPVSLDENSSEKVVKVKFQWRASAEGYREIEVAFRADGLIRRMTGTTATNLVIQFDFADLKINQGLLEERFRYNPPPSAYTHENFLNLSSSSPWLILRSAKSN